MFLKSHLNVELQKEAPSVKLRQNLKAGLSNCSNLKSGHFRPKQKIREAIFEPKNLDSYKLENGVYLGVKMGSSFESHQDKEIKQTGSPKRVQWEGDQNLKSTTGSLQFDNRVNSFGSYDTTPRSFGSLAGAGTVQREASCLSKPLQTDQSGSPKSHYFFSQKITNNSQRPLFLNADQVFCSAGEEQIPANQKLNKHIQKVGNPPRSGSNQKSQEFHYSQSSYLNTKLKSRSQRMAAFGMSDSFEPSMAGSSESKGHNKERHDQAKNEPKKKIASKLNINGLEMRNQSSLKEMSIADKNSPKGNFFGLPFDKNTQQPGFNAQEKDNKPKIALNKGIESEEREGNRKQEPCKDLATFNYFVTKIPQKKCESYLINPLLKNQGTSLISSTNGSYNSFEKTGTENRSENSEVLDQKVMSQDYYSFPLERREESIDSLNTSPQDNSCSLVVVYVQPTSFEPEYYMKVLQRALQYRGPCETGSWIQAFRSHFLQTFQALHFAKTLKPVDPKVIDSKKVTLERRPKDASNSLLEKGLYLRVGTDKKTLIFDLDETLVHCNETKDNSDVILPIHLPTGEIIEAGVNIRPWARECLKELSDFYEIIVFTASHSCYASVVLDYLDPTKELIAHRLYREHCIPAEMGLQLKNLKILGNRNLKDVLIIDNAAYSYGYQLENGIPCIPFFNDKADQELKHFVTYAKQIANVPELVAFNQSFFKFHMYSEELNPEVLAEKLFK